MLSDDIHVIDGSLQEGGGQIIRTALTLAAIQGIPIRIVRIRANRPIPGLRWQHVACVEAAVAITGGSATGATVRSTELTFIPGDRAIAGGLFTLGSIQSTASIALVLQTVLPILWLAKHPSTLIVYGATHVKYAPSIDFLLQSFLPHMPVQTTCVIERYAYAPASNGRVRVTVHPYVSGTVDVWDKGALLRTYMHLEQARPHPMQSQLRSQYPSLWILRRPGFAIQWYIECERIVMVLSGYSIEEADTLYAQVQAYCASDAPCTEHFADQLLLPLALFGGRFRAMSLHHESKHVSTSMQLIESMLGRPIFTEMDNQIHVQRGWIESSQSNPSTAMPSVDHLSEELDIE